MIIADRLGGITMNESQIRAFKALERVKAVRTLSSKEKSAYSKLLELYECEQELKEVRR